jgi:hypothetical protein
MTLYRWFSGNELVVAVIGGILALALVAVMVVRTYGRARRGRGQFIEPLRWVGPWLIVTQLLNPLSWRWGSVFVVAIPLATVDSRIWHRVVRKVLWGMVVVGWLLQLNPVVQFLGFDHWTYLHGSGLITFFWATLLLLSL